MPRLLQLTHGFPPRENAGVEQYSARTAEGLRARGWDVHTLAATLNPGAPMYRLTEEPGVTRMVNNAPYAALRHGAADGTVDRIVDELIARFRPDIVHIQHIPALSTTLPLPVPTVWTLHDAWAWCAAGGLLLHQGQPCPGPGPRCAACASAWARDTPRLGRALRFAGRLGPVVRAETLHAAWRRLPAPMRARATGGVAPPLDDATIDRRTAAMRALAGRCAALVTASRWLGAEASRQGLGDPVFIEQGRDPTPGLAPRDAPFLFLGTLAAHKGPHLVLAAWQRAALARPLRLHGPPGPDPAYTAALPHGGPVAAGDVARVLGGAQALVLGSTWPENAPLVILEARAAGCPIIAPAIGGIPEFVVDGVDGWLYPPGDVDALARCLQAADRHRPTPRPPPPHAAHLDQLETLYGRLGARAG